MVHISLESGFMAKVEEVCSKIKFCVHVLNGFLLAVVAGADVWLGTPCLVMPRRCWWVADIAMYHVTALASISANI